ncbi:C-C motif chemokine 18-like [Calypte anna]|uniref:C-C motif chemokine 18-like n=1 Tax=Calypte anna TaxID=9244 RepID=UPI0011C385E2|nr:C-C motif chemokine 18-like [Calypte anna]
MKVFSLSLLTLLLGTLWTGNHGISFRSLHGMCCSKMMFTEWEIPAFRIRSYEETPSHCPHRAVRVTLLRGKKLCVDPEQGWFQQYRRQKE